MKRPEWEHLETRVAKCVDWLHVTIQFPNKWMLAQILDNSGYF